jgi:ABC-type nitrate/sulfonate/bicarbonate transport system substrate-binding protein
MQYKTKMNKRGMSKYFGVLLVIVVVILIGGYFIYYLGQKTEDYSSGTEKVILGVETSLLPASVWIAEDKGYFGDYGLEVEIRKFDSGKASFNDMLNNGVDISTVAPTPIMFNSFDRDDFSIFATFVSSQKDVKVIAKKDSGIETAKDLKGKKIGIVQGSTSQYFLSAFLSYRNLKDSDVETIDFSPVNLPEALNNGDVDAIVIWEPHAYNALRLLGDNAISLPATDVYDETFNFMVMNEFAQANPETLVSFISAVDKATTFIVNNKDESQSIVSERLGLDKEVMTILWDEFVYEISLTQTLILTLEDEARWAIKNNLTEKTEIPNYLDYIYFDALREVKPEAISIIGYT